MWTEDIAGKGTQEVGTCIKHYCDNHLKPTAEELIIWGDTCGGQNRSIKLQLFLQQILQNHPTLKKITVRFFKSGHSYNDCDVDFAAFEKSIKKSEIFDLPSLLSIIQSSKANVKVTEMKAGDFYSVDNILKLITNRKKDEKKESVSWLSTHEITIEKDAPFTLNMRNHIDSVIHSVNIQRFVKKVGIPIEKLELSQSSLNRRPLHEKKIEDLKKLRNTLIPLDKREFWSFLDDAVPTNSAELIENFLPMEFDENHVEIQE